MVFFFLSFFLWFVSLILYSRFNGYSRYSLLLFFLFSSCFLLLGPIDISDIYMLSDVLFSFRCPFLLSPGSLTLQFPFDCPHSGLFSLSHTPCLVIYPSLKVIE